MKWHDFEIKERNKSGQYELILWETKDSYSTVALIDYDRQGKDFDVKSVGLRLFKHWQHGLDEYILRYLNLLQLQYKYD
jgi:hypothetical protein